MTTIAIIAITLGVLSLIGLYFLYENNHIILAELLSIVIIFLIMGGSLALLFGDDYLESKESRETLIERLEERKEALEERTDESIDNYLATNESFIVENVIIKDLKVEDGGLVSAVIFNHDGNYFEKDVIHIEESLDEGEEPYVEYSPEKEGDYYMNVKLFIPSNYLKEFHQK